MELLSRLLPTLSASDVELWLKTYLRPALDSAGFDLLYISKTRRFLESLTVDTFHTDDASLRQRRERIAQMTMGHVMQVYIGKDQKAYDMIQLSATEADMTMHVFAERRRFIERNATGVLTNWGLQYPKSFFLLLNPHFSEPKSRLKSLALASVLASKNVSATQTVVETPFYVNLLRCLCLDSSEPILRSALTVLMMLFGKICDKIALHLPELLIILSRLAGWNCGTSRTLFDIGTEADWVVAGFEEEPSVFKVQFHPVRKFDLQYLITLIYGLFPKSLISFANEPKYFLLQNPPTCLRDFVPDNFKNELALCVSKAILKCLERCMIHPNFLQGDSEKHEKKPIEWILKKNINAEIGEAEVLFECLSLNPEILITIPDEFSFSDKLLSKIRSSDHLHSILSSQKASTRSSSSLGEQKTGMRGVSSPSILDHALTAEKRCSPCQNNSPLDNFSGTLERIEFKPFAFDGNTLVNQNTSSDRDKSIFVKDDLSALFLEHEKSYTSSAPVPPSSLDQGEKESSNGTMSGRAPEKNEDSFKSISGTGGNILEFYQRELLLIRNELEFTMYMKSLYRLRYVKLKLRLNSMSESINKQPKQPVHDEDTKRMDVTDVSRSLLEEKEIKFRLKSDENECLLKKIAQMHSKLQELERLLKEAQAEVSEKSESLKKNRESLQEKEEEIIDLKNHNKFLQDQSKVVPKQTEKPIVVETPYAVTCNEGDILHLRTEIKMLQNQKMKGEADLEHLRRALEFHEKDVESQLSKTKLEMREAFTEQSKQYEKKIKELNGVLLRYETALQEERARATQLSKAIPIRTSEQQLALSQSIHHGSSNWPSGYNAAANEVTGDNPGTGYGDRTAKRGSHASVESLSLSSIPSTSNTPSYPSKQNSFILPRQASSASMPIIKGRGGYQKRSKKFM